MPVRERRRNPLTHVFVLVCSCIVFLMLFANQMALQSMFMPSEPSYKLDDGFRQVVSPDGTEVTVYFKRALGAKRTIFYIHGNAEDLGDVLPTLSVLGLRGYNVASFDYRGYGATTGIATEANVYEDGLAVFDYLIEDLGISEDSIVVMGRSLGGGVATEISRVREPAGLILESTFRSVYTLVLPIKWIPGDKFTNESKIGDVDCPLLIIHGTEDEVVPLSHSEALVAAADSESTITYWVDGAGHNDVAYVAGIAYWRRIESFIASL